MDMKKAETIAENPSIVDPIERREAYNWLEVRSLNKELSEEFRTRAQVARMKIFNWAFKASNNGQSYQAPSTKKSKKV